ncbi:MAG: iron-containing redox enzyme family protein [Actinomycetota bacterium]|nr:iron-containing redox enzyme family protein [Actinomycetota bacterium]
MRLPSARGPISESLVERLPGSPGGIAPIDEHGDPLFDDDFQLSLFVCYELHYRGFDEVSDGWEWEPSVIALRNELVAAFESALEAKVQRRQVRAEDVPAALKKLALASGGPSLSRYLEERATVEQFREFVMHRSIYHLREADPHTWVVPRLGGAPKAALVEIQADEYGGGILHRMHSSLFAGLMASFGLDNSYGAYVEQAPGATLATLNLMSTFGLHRRRRGAAVGHLALLEMDSSIPNRRYANGLRRLGFGGEVTRFYDEHVEADSVHEAIAAHDLAGALAVQEPELATDIVFGAEALAFVESYFAQTLLSAWEQDSTSLRQPAPHSR